MSRMFMQVSCGGPDACSAWRRECPITIGPDASGAVHRPGTSAAEVLVTGLACFADAAERFPERRAIPRRRGDRGVEPRAEFAGVAGKALVVRQVREGRFEIVGH